MKQVNSNERRIAIRKLDFTIIENKFSERGYILLSKEYINAQAKLLYICPKHPEEHKSISWCNFKAGKGCRECGIESVKEKQKLDFEFVKSEFNKRGYILLEDRYINNNTKMKYRCPFHPDKLLKMSWITFKHGSHCPYCAGVNKKEITFLEGEFKKRGYELLDREYTNSRTPLKFRCPKHPNKETSITWDSLKFGNGCKYCGVEKNSGEGHYFWKGGTSSIYKVLRIKLNHWRNKYLEEYNHECFITGVKGKLDVHHTISFLSIIKESFRINKVEYSLKRYELTKEEFEKIVETTMVIHNSTIGIPMSPGIHLLFHIEYGKTNISIDDVYEFKNRYANGEFNDTKFFIDSKVSAN